jgi:hypothetical protein
MTEIVYVKNLSLFCGSNEIQIYTKKNYNSVVLVRKRTIPTKRPQPAGEVSANFS